VAAIELTGPPTDWANLLQICAGKTRQLPGSRFFPTLFLLVRKLQAKYVNKILYP